jgi:SAM-dependent methyltransferase
MTTTGATSEKIAEQLIRVSQSTPFRGSGGYACLPALGPTGVSRFPQADIELSRVGDFFEFFKDPAGEARRLRGATVLDLGCGFGGRTVGYAQSYGARQVVGVEPFPHVIARCEEFAESMAVTNCRFMVNTQRSIPVASNSIDLAISYDVFEHVDNPVEMLTEVKRVLRPNGWFLLVFTPYFGALSHHLNYVTRLPGLHWLFRPQTLVAAVNRVLGDTGVARFGTSRQPPPHRSFGDKRWCLPGVNGMTGAEFAMLLDGYRVIDMHSTPLLRRFPILGKAGVWLNDAIASVSPTVAEAVSFNVVCVLQNAMSDSE